MSIQNPEKAITKKDLSDFYQEILPYLGRPGSGGGVVSHLSDIGDVSIINLADGQIIKWDATNSRWVNSNESSGGDTSSYVYSSATTLSTTLGDSTTVTLSNLSQANDSTAHPTAADISVGKTVAYDAAGTLGVATAISGSDVTIVTIIIKGSGGGASYTAGDGIEISQQDEISIKEMAAADMSEIVTPLPSTRSGGTVLKQTLTAGGTTVTFTGLPTTGDHIIDFFNSLGVNYTGITPTSGQVVLTFPAQVSNMDVYCEIREV